jgi:hypothetical protein
MAEAHGSGLAQGEATHEFQAICAISLRWIISPQKTQFAIWVSWRLIAQ